MFRKDSPPASEACIDIVISYEIDPKKGPLSKIKGDPGGTTKWGISHRAYPHLNIEELTKHEAMEIYKQDYWDEVSGDELPLGVDLMVYDAAVNQGIHTAKKMLQDALKVRADGVIGPITLSMLKKASPAIVARRVAVLRLHRYRTTHNVEKFAQKLWYPRMFDVIRDSVARLREEQ